MSIRDLQGLTRSIRFKDISHIHMGQMEGMSWRCREHLWPLDSFISKATYLFVTRSPDTK